MNRCHTFTLIEVIISILVLAMGIVGAMSMANMSSARVAKAYQRWESQNRLSQAAEYYLLCGSEGLIPDNIFPYKNVQASCITYNCRDLPSGVSPTNSFYHLTTYDITIKDTYTGKVLQNIKIDKITNENKTMLP